jgi:hypothetical protein
MTSCIKAGLDESGAGLHRAQTRTVLRVANG